jgi:hypothetical protein
MQKKANKVDGKINRINRNIEMYNLHTDFIILNRNLDVRIYTQIRYIKNTDSVRILIRARRMHENTNETTKLRGARRQNDKMVTFFVIL